MISEENKYCVLEKKAHHLESQLRAYESASENEVVNKLHSEVADVEQRVKSRNLEIQILERRVSCPRFCINFDSLNCSWHLKLKRMKNKLKSC